VIEKILAVIRADETLAKDVQNGLCEMMRIAYFEVLNRQEKQVDGSFDGYLEILQDADLGL